ncbi:MAG: hypothetical protein ACU84H_17270, partial [Gammaproteobacteria bacterium]
MATNRLSPELVSLVHHVELNQSGWWKKAVKKIIIAAIWSASRPLSSQEIKDILYEDFNIDLDLITLEAQIQVLRSEQIIISTDNKKLVVSQIELKSFEEELHNAEKDAEEAKQQFYILISSYCTILDPQNIWEKFNCNFLLPMIQAIGANTYRLMTGELSIQESEYLNNFLRSYDESCTDCLRRALTEFFSPK